MNFRFTKKKTIVCILFFIVSTLLIDWIIVAGMLCDCPFSQFLFQSAIAGLIFTAILFIIWSLAQENKRMKVQIPNGNKLKAKNKKRRK